jgi:hypothetical protein
MAAWLAVVAWCTGVVVVQSGKELSLAWAAETRVEHGKCVILVGLDDGSEVAKVLKVMIPDLCASPHHECTQDDDLVPGFVLAPLIVASLCEAAVCVDEAVSETSVESLAKTFQN